MNLDKAHSPESNVRIEEPAEAVVEALTEPIRNRGP